MKKWMNGINETCDAFWTNLTWQNSERSAYFHIGFIFSCVCWFASSSHENFQQSTYAHSKNIWPHIVNILLEMPFTLVLKFISPGIEKILCSRENFRSTWKLRPTWEKKMSFRPTWASIHLHHVSTQRASTADQNEFRTEHSEFSPARAVLL